MEQQNEGWSDGRSDRWNDQVKGCKGHALLFRKVFMQQYESSKKNSRTFVCYTNMVIRVS